MSQTTDITHVVPGFGGKAYSRVAPSYQRLQYGSKKKNQLYSATNGLYTIQSQSDESRRSSLSALNKKKDDEDYFTMESYDANKNVSSSLENSLGYLP